MHHERLELCGRLVWQVVGCRPLIAALRIPPRFLVQERLALVRGLVASWDKAAGCPTNAPERWFACSLPHFPMFAVLAGAAYIFSLLGCRPLCASP